MERQLAGIVGLGAILGAALWLGIGLGSGSISASVLAAAAGYGGLLFAAVLLPSRARIIGVVIALALVLGAGAWGLLAGPSVTQIAGLALPSSALHIGSVAFGAFLSTLGLAAFRTGAANIDMEQLPTDTRLMSAPGEPPATPNTPSSPFPSTQEGTSLMTDQLQKVTKSQCDGAPTRYDDLSVLMLNCTLTRSPNLSHTEGLMKVAEQIYQANGVKTEILRPVDYEIAAGLGLDYAGVDGYAKDDWPMIQAKIDACDILIIGTSVWLGEKSSVCNRVLERMYGYTHLLNERGQYRDYGKTGAVLITGNEDGVKHCAMNVLFSLSHIGYVVPPQADAGWMGEAGPGPSYMDPGSGGPENDFTNRNTTFLVWNTMHVARWLKDNGGFPAHGNQPDVWNAGCKTDFHSPEHRR